MTDQNTTPTTGGTTGASIIEWAIGGLNRQEEQCEAGKPAAEAYASTLSIYLTTGQTIHDVGHLELHGDTVRIGAFSDKHLSDHCVALDLIKGAHWNIIGHENLGATLLTWGATVLQDFEGAARLTIGLEGNRTIENISHIELDHGIADISVNGSGADSPSYIIDARLVQTIHLQQP